MNNIQCKANVKSTGERCQKPPMINAKYCYLHGFFKFQGLPFYKSGIIQIVSGLFISLLIGTFFHVLSSKQSEEIAEQQTRKREKQTKELKDYIDQKVSVADIHNEIKSKYGAVSDKIEKLLDSTNFLSESNDFNGAEEIFRNLLFIYPKITSLRNRYGHLLIQMNNHAGAIDEFLEVVNLEDTNLVANSSLGFIYLQQNKPDSSLIYYKKINGMGSKYELVDKYFLARVYTDLKEFDSARYYFNYIDENLNSLYPSKFISAVYLNYGAFYSDQDSLIKAIEMYKKSLEYENNNPFTLTNLGLMNMKLENDSIGIYYFKHALSINPNLSLAKTYYERALKEKKSK